ncbi:hypothetical protein [Streptomyces albidoflavus]|uniref:Uncharacterized protein n=1 Tax=Streptomyces albidoflavus TaxID=1886 RepID=A0AA37BZ93_9ACTN|nr:hypothetical protein [Streptomyces albidoflavus]RZE54063.1 hypothetical protein C0Q97_17870 [Streptomyces albidoflavus]WQG72976.1 hypothetical protein SR864_18290 [Streptomyces albidoflavus]GHI47565.1 hypothetical protein ScoT_37390 [Streptomyces albidoflavus]
MLTSAPPEALNVSRRPLPYRCRAAAYPLNEVRSIPMGSHNATSPRLALRWLRKRTRHITDQLDAAYARPGLHWLTDEAELERALAYLTGGTGYQLTLYDENTRYVLMVHPTGATS